MLTKIRNSVVGFGVLAMVLAGYFWFFDPSKDSRGRDKDHEMVVLKATWIPADRVHPVLITVLVTGEPPAQETDHHSPWVETIPVPRGSMVTLRASQPVVDLHLDCTAIVRGQTVGPNVAKPTLGGASLCSVSVRA